MSITVKKPTHTAQELFNKIIEKERMWPAAALERLPATVIYALIREMAEDMGLTVPPEEEEEEYE